MTGKLIYELPKHSSEVAVVVGFIPSDWCWIDGYFSATRKLYKSGEIAENTSLFISRFYSIKPTIVGSDDVPFEDENWKRAKKEGHLIAPKIADIVLKNKLFSSVCFSEAAFETKTITMDTVKELAEGFIKKDYKGWIKAYSGYKNNQKFSNPETLEFSHDKENIELKWYEEHGGKRENLDEIIENLERFGLKEIMQETTSKI